MLETRDTILVVILITVLGYYLQSGPKIGNFLSSSHVETFANDGIVVVDNLFTPDELEDVSKELMWRVDNRLADVRAEDLLNLHHNDSYIMGKTHFVSQISQIYVTPIQALASHPASVSAASQLLSSSRLRLFSTRILCKLPGQSIEIPWHQVSRKWNYYHVDRMPWPQDSAYWPLWPMRVATLWLALDDVTEENGAMEMFRFSDVPQTRNQNLNVTMVEETGADFFIKIDQDVLDSLPSEKSVKMTLSRGQAEFHDAYILHRSLQNRSSRQRFEIFAS